MKPSQYHPTKMKPIVQIVARLVQKNPALADDPDYLMAQIGISIPGFHNKKECINCGASMAEYLETLDVNDALLLINTAKEVRSNIALGMDFTEANKIRISSSNGITHTQKCRTTKCSKLGLLAKSGQARWAVTSRGWDALRGEPVPKTRTTFRGQIIERQEELTTFREVFADHRAKMVDLEKRKKATKNDYRDQTEAYDPSEWYEIAGYHDGAVL